MQENLFYTTIINLGWKKTTVYLMYKRFIWALTTERRYASWQERLFYIEVLKNITKNNISLYCDDSLTILKAISEPKSEKVKKNIQKLFKENELNIVI